MRNSRSNITHNREWNRRKNSFLRIVIWGGGAVFVLGLVFSIAAPMSALKANDVLLRLGWNLLRSAFSALFILPAFLPIPIYVHLVRKWMNRSEVDAAEKSRLVGFYLWAGFSIAVALTAMLLYLPLQIGAPSPW